MKTENEVASGWEDLIFENRNKEYGAYDIRKSYSGNATTAAGICLLGAVGFLVLSGFSFLNKKDPSTDTGKDSTIIVFPPPRIEPIKPPVQTITPPPARQLVRDLTPVVVSHNVEDEPEAEDPAPPVIDDHGDPNGSVDVNTGDFDLTPAVSLPVIDDDKPFITAEVMPSYVGGMEEMIKYLQRKLRYPSKSQRMEIQGTVYVGFIVNREGKVVDVSIVRGISDDCDKEAIRVISAMPAWKAGSQQGRAVSVRMVLPVTFKLNPNR
ncbi:MAG TPA: TonB family protein [Ohtaekwangia sp.]